MWEKWKEASKNLGNGEQPEGEIRWGTGCGEVVKLKLHGSRCWTPAWWGGGCEREEVQSCGGTAGERNEEPNGEGLSLGSRGNRPQNGKQVCCAWGWLGEELVLGCFVVIRPWGPGAGFRVAKTRESWTVDQHFPKKNENEEWEAILWVGSSSCNVGHSYSQDASAKVWSGYSVHLPHSAASRHSASYFRNMQCKAFKQQSFQLLAGHLFPRMPCVCVVVIII